MRACERVGEGEGVMDENDEGTAREALERATWLAEYSDPTRVRQMQQARRFIRAARETLGDAEDDKPSDS